MFHPPTPTNISCVSSPRIHLPHSCLRMDQQGLKSWFDSWPNLIPELEDTWTHHPKKVNSQNCQGPGSFRKPLDPIFFVRNQGKKVLVTGGLVSTFFSTSKSSAPGEPWTSSHATWKPPIHGAGDRHRLRRQRCWGGAGVRRCLVMFG